MNAKELTVLMVEPGKHPKVTKLKDDLDSLQKADLFSTVLPKTAKAPPCFQQKWRHRGLLFGWVISFSFV